MQSHTDGTVLMQEQFGVQYLAQVHFDMSTAGFWDGTTNLSHSRPDQRHLAGKGTWHTCLWWCLWRKPMQPWGSGLHIERPCLSWDLNPGPSIIQKVGVKGVRRDPEVNFASHWFNQTMESYVLGVGFRWIHSLTRLFLAKEFLLRNTAANTWADREEVFMGWRPACSPKLKQLVSNGPRFIQDWLRVLCLKSMSCTICKYS